MERRKALIVAGFLAATVTSAVLLFGAYAANAAADRPVSTTVTAGAAAVESVADDQAYLAEMQATLAERETILAAQLAQNKDALSQLDQEAQARLADMQVQIDGAATATQSKSASLQTLQAQTAELQRLIEQDAVAAQAEMAALQAADAQLMEQLNAATAQLQGAYSEIAARQDTAAQAAGNNAPARYEDDDDHEEHEEHEDHDDGDHDEHEEHDDD